MYIEQLLSRKTSLALYLPLPLCFFAFMIFNYIQTQDLDSEEILKNLIAQIGINAAFFAVVAPLAFLCLVLLLWVKFAHQQSITSLTTSRKSIDWKRVFFSFTLWGVFLIISILVSYYNSPEKFLYNFKLIPFILFLLMAIVLIPLQTSFEEYLFRGYLMQGLGLTFKNRWIPLFFTSLTFGLMHIANPEVGKMGYIILLYYIGTGFFLGIMTLMDEGLELALGFHAANNLIGALVLTSDWSAFQTHAVLKDMAEPSVGIDVLLPIFVLFPIILFVFSKKYGWQNWSDKLFGTAKVL